MTMLIEPRRIKVREIANGYTDKSETEGGVTGYSGDLNIRPPYQREFVYNDRMREAVIHTVLKGYPLNILYWIVNDDGTYEVMDGQQRLISLCKFIAGEFSITVDKSPRYFKGLSTDEKNLIRNYVLTVYFCSDGTDSEKLGWFDTVNIAGLVLSPQELRNPIYTGPWLSHAKTKFSKTNCVAYRQANQYVTGTPNRQEYLERVLSWISNGNILTYMSAHQNDADAEELWSYFQAVIAWIKQTFPTYRKEMKSVNWGSLYNQYKDDTFDPAKLEEEIKSLLVDEEVTSQKGIWSYVLTREEKHLSIRMFNPAQRRTQYERQSGICTHCDNHFEIIDMEADHVTPWIQGGKTTLDNCQMVCREANRKGDKRSKPTPATA